MAKNEIQLKGFQSDRIGCFCLFCSDYGCLKCINLQIMRFDWLRQCLKILRVDFLLKMANSIAILAKTLLKLILDQFSLVRKMRIE